MLRGRVQGGEELPAVNDAEVRDYSYELYLCKCVGPTAPHPRLLKELADVKDSQLNFSPMENHGASPLGSCFWDVKPV